MSIDIPNIYGSVTLKSELKLEEISTIISSAIFLGSPFGGLERQIYEEVPVVLLDGSFLGLDVILSGGGEYDYSISVHGNYKPKGIKSHRIQLDEYLYFLFRDKLKEYENIEIAPPRTLEGRLNETL